MNRLDDLRDARRERERARRGLETVPGAQEQLVLESVTQPTQRVTDRGLRHREVLSRNCELAMPHHRMKNPQEIEIEPPEASIPITGVHI